MKKALVAWLVLLVMAVSAMGFAEVDVSRDIGDWQEDNKGHFGYINETLNLKFSMGSWDRYRSRKTYAADDNLSVSEWLNSVRDNWEKYDIHILDDEGSNYSSVMYAKSKNGKLWVDIDLGRVGGSEKISETELEDQLLTEFKAFVEKDWRKVEEINEDTISFLNETKKCLKIKHTDVEGGFTRYEVFVFVIKDGYVARIRMNSDETDLTKTIAGKFSLLK